MKKIGLIGAAVLVLAAPVAAAIPRADYRSDAQAERFLKRGLKRWAGRDLMVPGLSKSAFCINGYYSRHEQRTHRHFHPVERTGRHGEPLFRSFTCMFTVESQEYDLYLITYPHGKWSVSADR